MKINKPMGTSPINPYQQQVTNLAQKKGKDKQDHIQISSEAKAMLDNQTKLDPARQEKIHRLKGQVQSGQYHVNSQQVADSLYQFWFTK